MVGAAPPRTGLGLLTDVNELVNPIHGVGPLGHPGRVVRGLNMKAASDQIKDLPSLFAWLRADYLGELRKKLVVARFGHQRRVWSEAAYRQADKPEKLLLLGDLQTPYREGR